MLTCILSLITCTITSIKSLIGFFVFRPPKPAAYKTEITRTDDILKERGKCNVYETVEFSTIKHEYMRVPDSNGTFIPVILLRPVNCFKLCIVYSHGNSCDMGISFFECVDISLNTNCCVLMYEYPGYGLCHNRKLSEEAIYYNIRKVYDFARSELSFNQDEIILYGHSLGTGPSVDLAIDDKYPVAALVLQAPFLSILRTVADTPFYDYFSNIDKVSKIKTPTLIIHGTKDTIIFPEDGETLAKLIPSEHLYEFLKIQDGDHNDIIKNHKSKVYKKLREFLNQSTKKNFSFESKGSKVDINSDFFKKLQPRIGDRVQEEGVELEMSPILGMLKEEENFRSIVIRNYIENENNVVIDLNDVNEIRRVSGNINSSSTNEPNIIVKQEDVVIEIINNDKYIKEEEVSIKQNY